MNPKTIIKISIVIFLGSVISLNCTPNNNKELPVCSDSTDIPIILKFDNHQIVFDADNGTSIPLHHTFSMMNQFSGRKYKVIEITNQTVTLELFIKDASTYHLDPLGYKCLVTIDLANVPKTSNSESSILLQSDLPDEWKIISYINLLNKSKTDFETSNLISEKREKLIINNLKHDDFNYELNIISYDYNDIGEASLLLTDHIISLQSNSSLQIDSYPITSSIKNNFAYCRQTYAVYCSYYGASDTKIIIFQLSSPVGPGGTPDELESDFVDFVRIVEENLFNK